MTIFAPTDPGPARPASPAHRGPAVRLVPPPGASCAAHQVWDDSCRRCRVTRKIRQDAIARAHRAEVLGLAKVDRFGHSRSA